MGAHFIEAAGLKIEICIVWSGWLGHGSRSLNMGLKESFLQSTHGWVEDSISCRLIHPNAEYIDLCNGCSIAKSGHKKDRARKWQNVAKDGFSLHTKIDIILQFANIAG
ncbi:hypothetical protein ACH5RR_041679 [Cinchona calisaya]|uniref:Uncharacterized protein n=1 Tax=Cinchona calisaya TaxID=153742 RepID=A0ABD2XZI3_9GENT